jgi:hypothetical protein
VGYLRFRRSLKIAPGVRLNFNKRSVGISAGVRGARYSVNSSGTRTRSVGIPGTGLSYISRSRARRRGEEVGEMVMPSPTRLLASLVGWLTVSIFVIGLLNGGADIASRLTAYGIVAYIILRVLRGVLDPIFLWLLTRRASANQTDS